MKELIDRVWDFSQKYPQGYTINIESLTHVESGITVGFKETQNSFSKQSIECIINHAKQNDKIIGGWYNAGNYYFDSVKLFKPNELDKALEFAKENNQLAVFDLIKMIEIKVGV